MSGLKVSMHINLSTFHTYDIERAPQFMKMYKLLSELLHFKIHIYIYSLIDLKSKKKYHNAQTCYIKVSQKNLA